jgi:rhodanese-related sulfurtransferase
MTQAVENIQAADLAAMLSRGEVVLVDVREPVEYFADRIAGAVLFPLSAFDPYRLPKAKIVFQCGSGKRSLTAIQLSAGAGLAHTSHLQGGLAAWKQAGLHTIRG